MLSAQHEAQLLRDRVLRFDLVDAGGQPPGWIGSFSGDLEQMTRWRDGLARTATPFDAARPSRCGAAPRPIALPHQDGRLRRAGDEAVCFEVAARDAANKRIGRQRTTVTPA